METPDIMHDSLLHELDGILEEDEDTQADSLWLADTISDELSDSFKKKLNCRARMPLSDLQDAVSDIFDTSSGLAKLPQASSGGDCSRPCASCRAARVRCDRQMPCARCTRLGVPCMQAEARPRGRPARPKQNKPPGPSPLSSTPPVQSAAAAVAPIATQLPPISGRSRLNRGVSQLHVPLSLPLPDVPDADDALLSAMPPLEQQADDGELTPTTRATADDDSGSGMSDDDELAPTPSARPKRIRRDSKEDASLCDVLESNTTLRADFEASLKTAGETFAEVAERRVHGGNFFHPSKVRLLELDHPGLGAVAGTAAMGELPPPEALREMIALHPEMARTAVPVC